MKTNCDVIKDLMPLYVDDVCTLESKRLVEEHIAECIECNNDYNKLNDKIQDNLNITYASELNPLIIIKKRNNLRLFLVTISIIFIALLFCIIFANYKSEHSLKKISSSEQSVSDAVSSINKYLNENNFSNDLYVSDVNAQFNSDATSIVSVDIYIIDYANSQQAYIKISDGIVYAFTEKITDKIIIMNTPSWYDYSGWLKNVYMLKDSFHNSQFIDSRDWWNEIPTWAKGDNYKLYMYTGLNIIEITNVDDIELPSNYYAIQVNGLTEGEAVKTGNNIGIIPQNNTTDKCIVIFPRN